MIGRVSGVIVKMETKSTESGVSKDTEKVDKIVLVPLARCTDPQQEYICMWLE